MILTPVKETRLEYKFITKDRYYYKLKHWIKMHPLGFNKAYPSRQINNIYFDTYDLKSYKDNLSGISSRVKIRYRWYGESISPAPGTLEIKCKRNLHGWKFKHPIKNLSPSSEDTWREIKTQISSQLSAGWRIHFNARPQQVLINRYFRDYFISQDGKTMLNLDTQQMVLNQRNKLLPNYKIKASLPCIVIIEAKVDRENQELIPTTLKNLPLVWSRHSKYVEGVNAIRAS